MKFPVLEKLLISKSHILRKIKCLLKEIKDFIVKIM